MAQGGFKYAEVSLTLDKSTYTNVDQWCLAVHKARCEAFLRASQRWRDHYIPIQTNEPGEESAEINYDAENTCTVYYNPISDASGNVPSSKSYSSFFKHPDTDFEYVIITNDKLGINASGIPYVSSKICIPYVGGSLNNYALGASQNHGCSPVGFNSYKLKDTSVGFIIPVGGFTSHYQSVYGSGLIGKYSSIATNTTFRFGASVKDEVIFAFFFTRNTDKFPFWSVVGKILSDDSLLKYGGMRCSVSMSVDAEISSTPVVELANVCITCIRYDDKVLNQANSGNNYLKTNLGFCYSPSISNIEKLPDKIPYSAIYASYTTSDNSKFSIKIEDSIDNKGTLSFLVNPDIVAFTSYTICEKFYCQTICNGNYIINNHNTDSTTNYTHLGGFIIGWDPSNPPLI